MTISNKLRKILTIIELNEYVTNLPSFVQDTTHFLRKIEEIRYKLPKDAILFTMDIKSLYPSVPRKEGLEACKEALEKRKHKSIATDAVMQMLEVTLDNNIFQLNNKNYIQTEGTAIGSRLGRNFACTYLGVWEKDLLSRSTTKPWIYLRYVDDIFGIWSGNAEELTEFHKLANLIHPNIQVTIEQSRTSISFLDVIVEVKEGTLETDIFRKSTDKNMYVQKLRSSLQNVPFHMDLV